MIESVSDHMIVVTNVPSTEDTTAYHEENRTCDIVSRNRSISSLLALDVG